MHLLVETVHQSLSKNLNIISRTSVCTVHVRVVFQRELSWRIAKSLSLRRKRESGWEAGSNDGLLSHSSLWRIFDFCAARDSVWRCCRSIRTSGASESFHALALDRTEGASGKVVVEAVGAGRVSEPQAPMFDWPYLSSAYGEVIGSGEATYTPCRRRRRTQRSNTARVIIKKIPMITIPAIAPAGNEFLRESQASDCIAPVGI
jgi:hypothetical protein